MRGGVDARGGRSAWGDFGGTGAKEGTAEFGELRRGEGLGKLSDLVGEVGVVGCTGV